MSVILPYKDHTPDIDKDVFIATGAAVIGAITIGKGSSVWFNCSLRADMNSITIGEDTNVQDNTVIHIASQGIPTIIGSRVTIGHSALIHACTIHDDAFIGMGAILLDGSVIESGAFIAAGALVPPRTRARSGILWAGNPAKPHRPLKQQEKTLIAETPRIYKHLARSYLAS